MKKIKEYYFNDGMDGVVVAKNLKQAVKKISKHYEINPNVLLKDIKTGIKIEEYSDEVWLVEELLILKKGHCKRSRVLGWCE